MNFKQSLAKRLAGKIPPALNPLLPSGYQSLGQIIILNLKLDLREYEKEIGSAVLDAMPRFKTACNRIGEITGQFRQPQLKVIAGLNDTQVIHHENQCTYAFDARKIMFSQGNTSEKRRLAGRVREGETVIDFFAGIGYFTIPIAVLSKPSKIYSIELNPVAFHYLQKNIELNHVRARVQAIHGDCTTEGPKLGRIADRVILGLLPAPKFALPAALEVVKNGGVIHYEGVCTAGEPPNELFQDVANACADTGLKPKLENVARVKSFGPRKEHVVLDIKLR